MGIAGLETVPEVETEPEAAVQGIVQHYPAELPRLFAHVAQGGILPGPDRQFPQGLLVESQLLQEFGIAGGRFARSVQPALYFSIPRSFTGPSAVDLAVRLRE